MWLKSLSERNQIEDTPSLKQVPSLRKRFIIAGIALISFIALITIQLVFTYSKNLADLSYDRLLRSALLQMDENVIFVDNEVSIDIPWSAFATLAQANEDRIFYRVESSSKGFITGNAELVTHPPVSSELGKMQFYNQGFSGELIRLAWLEREVTEVKDQGTIRIILGQTRLSRDSMSSGITISAIKIIILIATVAIFLIVLGSYFVLQPLRQITALLEARQPGDLTPITIDTPKETLQLKNSLNHFMERLQKNLEQLENFTAESAHQLRTPIASLQALAENARDQMTPVEQQQAIEQIVLLCEKLSQTVTLYLNQAVVSHRLQTQKLCPLDIVYLARQACMEQAVVALNQGVLLSFESKVSKVLILGDAFSLQQMLNNLIDNAVRYSEVSSIEQQHVEICVDQDTYEVNIRVIDHGRGIDNEEKNLVFERFYRGRYEVPGSGVGLAMVKEIASRHNAKIEIKNTKPKGATIEVAFPIYYEQGV